MFVIKYKFLSLEVLAQVVVKPRGVFWTELFEWQIVRKVESMFRFVALQVKNFLSGNEFRQK